jgi:hypothetical protein
VNAVVRSDIHEEAFVNAGGKTSTGLPKHPFGITVQAVGLAKDVEDGSR